MKGSSIFCQPGLPADAYVKALDDVTAALKIAPDDRHYLNTLGVAQYRAGRFEEALATLRRSHELSSKADGHPDASDLAFLAMSCHHLGRHAEARQYMEELRALMKTPQGAGFTEQHFFREAERTIAGKRLPDARD